MYSKSGLVADSPFLPSPFPEYPDSAVLTEIQNQDTKIVSGP
jgi:hypothetical protein